MRRDVLVAFIAIGALCLGVFAILRGQAAIGVCFIGLALLRGFLLLQGLRPRKPQPSIRLNIDGDSTGSGDEDHDSSRPGS